MPVKLKIFEKKNIKKIYLFRYNLTQSYSKCIYCVFVEYTRHRLEITNHTSAHTQSRIKRLRG